jgi:hypothetical protein
MNFLGCDGIWQTSSDGSTICTGTLQTFTAQEMRDSLSPSLTMAQRAEITTALLGLFVFVWVCKTVRNSF